MKKIVVMTAVLLASQPGYADGYFGVGLGAGYAHDASNNATAGNSTLAQYGIGDITSHDDRSGAVSLLGGYRFNKYLAAEIDYNYLGTYDLNGFAAPGRTPPAGSESDRISALSLAAVLTAPFNNSLALYAKAGPTVAMNEEWTCVSNIYLCDSNSDTTNGMMYGLGVILTFPRLIGEIHLEADQFTDVGDAHNEFTAGRLSLVQIQYVYSFEEQ